MEALLYVLVSEDICLRLCHCARRGAWAAEDFLVDCMWPTELFDTKWYKLRLWTLNPNPKPLSHKPLSLSLACSGGPVRRNARSLNGANTDGSYLR